MHINLELLSIHQVWWPFMWLSRSYESQLEWLTINIYAESPSSFQGPEYTCLTSFSKHPITGTYRVYSYPPTYPISCTLPLQCQCQVLSHWTFTNTPVLSFPWSSLLLRYTFLLRRLLNCLRPQAHNSLTLVQNSLRVSQTFQEEQVPLGVELLKDSLGFPENHLGHLLNTTQPGFSGKTDSSRQVKGPDDSQVPLCPGCSSLFPYLPPSSGTWSSLTLLSCIQSKVFIQQT